MSDNTNSTFKLSDDSISVIAKNLQLALLTGTDIVDHLRMMEMTVDTEGNLFPTDNYTEQFEINVQTMLQTLRKYQEEQTSDTEATTEDIGKFEGDNPFNL